MSSQVRWSVPLAMSSTEQLLPLARAAEALGYDAIALPDSVFYPESVSAAYPFSDDGERFWAPDTPFVDPFIAIAAMAAVTDRIGFYTNVYKLPLRSPLLAAKEIASLAVMSGDRFGLGVGLAWIPEEFRYTDTDKRTRGVRTDEAIEIIRQVCAGGGPSWVEHHGVHYAFDPVMISPAPDHAVPIFGAGHSDAAMKRSAQRCDGWISAQSTFADLTDAIASLRSYRADSERADEPFDMKALCTEAFDRDSFARVVELGVTDVQVVPWYYFGGDPGDLDVRLQSLERFRTEVIDRIG